VNVSSDEVGAISRYLAISPEQAAKEYTVADPEDGGRILRHTQDGCVFLDGNFYLVYDARPRACREFPYLAETGRSLGGRMSSVCKRAWFCPIVYNALENL
jgi:Fe-S-cluster containining protein